jgi:hypothetical protein
MHYAHSNCAICGEHSYATPLHGSAGGPLCCLPCIGKWNAEHAPRRRARRVVIKALKAYGSVGGDLYGKDFDNLKFVAAGFYRDDAASVDFGDLTSELLTATLALTHPDKHPPERKAEAQRVTQELLALKPFVFPAPPPKPPPKPGDVCSKQPNDDLNKPSLPAKPSYPCEECRDTVPSLYCDACRTRWQEKQEEERKREEQKRLEKNASQRERYKELKAYRRTKPVACASCGKSFKPKRADGKYCSAACRQRTYLKRDGKPSNSKPLSPEQIEKTITDALTSNPDNALTTDDLCGRVFPGITFPERKHRAAVVPVAKRVCERLGEHWTWWRSEMRGGMFVFLNHASVTSYAMARLKTDFINGHKSEEELRAGIAPGGYYHKYVAEGGAWWGHCQEAIAKFKQTTAKQNDASADLTNRHAEAA